MTPSEAGGHAGFKHRHPKVLFSLTTRTPLVMTSEAGRWLQRRRVCDTSSPTQGDCGTLYELMIVQGHVAGVDGLGYVPKAAPVSAGGDIYEYHPCSHLSFSINSTCSSPGSYEEKAGEASVCRVWRPSGTIPVPLPSACSRALWRLWWLFLDTRGLMA